MLDRAADHRDRAADSVGSRVTLLAGDMRHWAGCCGARRRATSHISSARRHRSLYDRFDGQVLSERLATDFVSHVYSPAELELLVLSAGFEVVRQYGSHAYVPVDRLSPYLVTVARRPRRDGRRRPRR